jgi:Fe-S-cluster containining protein
MVSPVEAKAAAQKLEDENLKFRIFLRNRADDDELDAHIQRLHTELFADYDCCACTNCCKEYTILIGADEVPPVAQYLGLSDGEFLAEHLTENVNPDEDEGEYTFKVSPCAFLGEGGRCRIQECKPSVCREYPYNPERLSSMYSILASAEVCPVVFEVIERLKQIYHFRRNRL